MTTTTDNTFATTTNDKQTIVASASYVRPYDGGNSAKYVAIDSEQLILELQKRGFVLRQINRAKSGKGRHIVRMRSAEFTEINGEKLFPEIVFQNSYDRKCSFSVEMGIFRLVCSNGLTVRVKGTEGQMYTTRHIGEPAKMASDITMEFTKNLENVWNIHRTLTAKKLTDKQMIALAMRAAELRFKQKFTATEAKKLLAVKRDDDKGNSAWHIFNVLQENTVMGGVQLEGQKRTPKPVERPRTLAVLNQKLFDAAFEMATTGRLAPLTIAQMAAAEMAE